MNNTLFFQLLRAFAIFFLIIICFLLIKYTLIYIYPFLIATCIAFFLHPIVSLIETRWKVSRGFVTFLVMGAFFSLFLTLIYYLIKQLIQESTNLITSIPEIFDNMSAILSHIGQTVIIRYYEKVSERFTFLPAYNEVAVNQYFQNLFEQLSTSSASFIKNIIMTTSTILTSLTYVSTILLFILLASFIITKDLNLIRLKYEKNIPVKITQQLKMMMNQLKKSIFGFLKAQVIITIISTIIIFIGLLIFRVDHVFTITMIFFFIDFIPYVGVGIIFIPWMIYNFYTAHYVLTIQLAILYSIIIIARQIIEPKILASSIGIHPLIAIIILFIGIQSLGLIGIVITPIILIVISAIYRAGIIHYVWTYIKNG